MSLHLRRTIYSGLALSAAWSWPTGASAQVDLTEEQSRNFYITQIGSIGLLSAASLAVVTDPELALGPGMRTPPQFEESTSENSSPFSSHISDVTLYATVLSPLVTLYEARQGFSYGNSLIVYGQAMSSTVLLTAMTKQLALRARPDRWESTPDDPDDHHSFVSGHSSWSFTAAMSGSYLHSAVESDLSLRSLHWGAALALASFTAHARVRAGRHFPTDVLAGSVLGAGVGLAVPLLHGIDADLHEEEITAAAFGLFLGTVVGSLLPDRPLKQISSLNPQLSASENGMSIGVSGRFY